MKSVICPTVTALNLDDYNTQIKRLAPFAKRVHIDLMDGQLAPTVSPSLDEIWWPPKFIADIHLMYQRPMDHLKKLIMLKPNMVIIHAEADVHHMHFAAELHKEGIKAGLSVLPDTDFKAVEPLLGSFDHLLLFSGHLGHFGGKADLSLLTRAQEAKNRHPSLEIGWDGGINDQNAHQLAEGGIEVLNVGGFIQKAEDPAAAYELLLNSL